MAGTRSESRSSLSLGSATCRDDLRVRVLRKMHKSLFSESLEEELLREFALSPKTMRRTCQHPDTAESTGYKDKRSKSLSPLIPRRRNQHSIGTPGISTMATLELTTGGLHSRNSDSQLATGPSTPFGSDAQPMHDPANPEIAVTSAAVGQHSGSGGSGSEASHESDQQGVVVTFRKAASRSGGNEDDAKSGSDSKSRSVSAENVSFQFVDRRNSHSRKNSPAVSGSELQRASAGSSGHPTPTPTPTPVVKGHDNGGSPKPSKRERKISSGAGSATVIAAAASVGGGAAAVAASMANASSISQTQLTQTVSSAPSTGAGEKTRLQTAATHIKNLLAPNYKSRAEEFRKLFKPPENDKFVIDYSCAYQREILIQGRMYMSQNWLCFYANILFKWETTLVIRFKDITSITKEKTAKVIPNAIQVCTKNGEKLFFTSYSMRDKAYMMMFKIWQNALLDQPMNPAELWGWAQHGYDEAEFSGDEADQEAEDALLTTFPDDPNDRARQSGDSEQFRRLVASAPMDSVPPLQNLPTGDSVTGSEEDSVRSARAAVMDDGHLLRPRVAKIPRLASGASSPGTTATTPAEEYTESENDTEVSCPCQAHAGKEILNCVFPISVDQLFLLLFTDSVFFRKLHEDRKTTDLVLSDWQIDKPTATKSRQITYTVALNHSVGPKSCGVTEKQICTAASKPGQLYVMKCDVCNMGVPYADTFSVGVQYCLSRVSANQCRIRVHAAIVYKKSCWGIVKSFIEKNALVGIQDFFSDLNTHLHAECARFGLTDANEELDASKRSTLRLRNRTVKTPQGIEERDILVQSASARRASNIVYPLLPSEVENIAKGILVVLILMLLLNAALFYKLWYFEAESERGSFEHTLRDFERVLTNSDLSPSEWLRVFHQVRQAQKQQLTKWLDELDTAIKRVSDVETSLADMRKQIATMQKDFRIDAALRAHIGDIPKKVVQE